jgi:hypothetical protein
MGSESPYLDIKRGGEVEKPDTPEDLLNYMSRGVRQNEAIMEITHPETPEIFNQQTAGNYAYEPNQTIKKRNKIW